MRTTRHSTWAWAGVAGCLALFAGAAHADYFMHIEDNSGSFLQGSSTATGFENWIEISSLSWGVTVPQRVGGVAGKPDFSDFSWTQGIDSSFPGQFEAAAQNSQLKQVTIDFTRGIQPTTYFEMIFKPAYFDSLSLQTGGASLYFESASISYGSVQVTYLPQDGGLPETAYYNLRTGTGDLANVESLFALGQAGSPAGPGGAPLGAVPEASTWLMLGSGLAFLVLAMRRRTGMAPLTPA